MPHQPLLLLTACAALVAGALFLRGTASHGPQSRFWGWAWIGLWLAGMAIALLVPLTETASTVIASVATVLTLIGALELLRQRKAQERRLDDEHRTLLATLEASPDGMLLGGRDGAVLHMSGRFAELFDLESPSSWHGRHARELIDELRPRVEPHTHNAGILERIADDPMVVIDDLELEVRGPHERVLTCYSAPIVSPDGAHLGRVSVVHDRTEERRLEAELRHAQRMETIGTLAGGVAHDFNNQLMAIFGNLELARESTDDPATVETALRDLERAADHCAAVTRSLLTFAKRTPVRTRVVQLVPVVEEVVRIVPGASPTAPQVEVDLDADLPDVLADVTHLHQILLNLVLNARDATAATGGTIRVSARSVPAGSRSTKSHSRHLPAATDAPATDAPGHLRLSVSDDGVGMEAETLERIFDPFFSTKPQGEGTGLGLSIVHSLVQAHGGWLEVESRPGVGSRFDVFLPAAAPASDTDSAPRPDEKSGARETGITETGATGAGREERGGEPGEETTPQLILIADDEEALRKLITRALTGHGYRVLEANDGQEAIELYRERSSEVSLLLLDLSMPRMDGKQVIQQVRRERPEIPIILASGHFGEERPSVGPSVEILPKPFSLDVLLQIVRQQISVGRSEGENPAN